MAAQLEQEQKWNELRLELLRRIEEIDQATPFSPAEPAWWLQMMEVKRSALGNKSYNDASNRTPREAAGESDDGCRRSG